MSSTPKIEFNSSGFVELLKSNEVQGYVVEMAKQVQNRCGSGYDTDVYMTPSRVVASVYTEDTEAMKDNLENNTLLKSLR